MTDRDDLLEAIGAFALGVLPERDARAVRAAVTADPALRAEYAELRRAADAVGTAAEATLTDLDELAASRLKRRVLSAIRVSVEAADGVVVVPVARPWRERIAFAVAAAAVVVAVLSFGSASSLRLQLAATRAAFVDRHARDVRALESRDVEVASARNERRDVEAVLSERAVLYPIAYGDVVRSHGRLYLALHRLHALPPGKVYQAWTIARGAAPVPGRTFVPEGDVTIVGLGAPAAGVTAVALTIEPRGGSRHPTTKPTFVRRIG